MFKLKEIKNDKIVFAIIALFTLFVVFVDSGFRYNLGVLSLYFSIGILSLIGVFFIKDKAPYSLNKIFCLFFYFFFCLAPVVQFKNEITFQLTFLLSNELYLLMGSVILLILIGYLFLYNWLYVKIRRFTKINMRKPSYKSHEELNILSLYILSVSTVLLYVYLIKFEWELLVFRPYAFKLKNNTAWGLVGYAVVLIIRYIPFFVLLYYKLITKINTKHTLGLGLLFFVVLFPTSLSRGVLAVVYIPVVLLFVPVLRKGVNFVLLFFTGLLVVFPLWNSFRHLKEGQLKLDFELFASGHFDAFQNFALLVDEAIVTNGRQLLGSILFFVQESQWNNRPPGSGHLVGETVGYYHLNVAMPYFGEGYINFGWFGVSLFLLMIVCLNVFFDAYTKENQTSNLFKITMLVLLSWEFYLLRGDLMSALKMLTSFGLGLLCFSCFLFLLTKVNFKLK